MRQSNPLHASTAYIYGSSASLLRLVTTFMACEAKRAPSLWLKYDYSEPGDILVQDVYVPSSGLAKCTYYCCMNWNSGQEGGGYCGIQDHPDGRAFIFSIWDPQKVKDVPITAVSKGPGTWTDRFGGEGTGLKSMNFELGWKEDQWYTMVVRRWNSPDGEATRFGCWVHDHNLDTWTHLITMEYPVPQVYFTGRIVSFLEDWGFTSQNYRCVHYKGGFKRRLDKTWMPFDNAEFEVNMYDVKNGTATTNFKAHCKSPKEGICIAAGADVKGDTGTCCAFNNQACDSHPKKQSIKLKSIKPVEKLLSWAVDKGSPPHFGFKVMAGETEVCSGIGESVRGVQLDECVLQEMREEGVLVLKVEDILGNCATESCSLAGLK